MQAKDLTIVVRGRFRILSADGRDLTPKNRKERALIALLALRDDHRASRLWLQSMLWSASPPAKASSSLRTALKNILKAFPATSPLLDKDRNEVWLTTNVRVDFAPEGSEHLDLLELVDARDNNFDNWLRDLRAGDSAARRNSAESAYAPPRILPAAEGETVLVVRSNSQHTTDKAGYLEAVLITAICARFEAEGADTIYAEAEPDPEVLARAATVIHIELVSVVEDNEWSVHLRALADTDRRFLWSGRMQVEAATNAHQLGLNVAPFVSKAMNNIVLRYHAFRNARQSPLMVIARAATHLYDPSLEKVAAAEHNLSRLKTGEATAVALAWQGFSKLVRYLEFRETAEAEAAKALAEEALSLRPANALISALGARVAMDMTGDLDRAHYLARMALDSADDNPYALKAAARVELKSGRYETAHELAIRARAAAEGLPHAFAWDFELCLTALARNDFEAAQDAARLAHHSNARHRASLRYLVATSLITNDLFEAEHAAARLSGLEPGFEIADLFKDGYPIHTLQNLGLMGEIQPV